MLGLVKIPFMLYRGGTSKGPCFLKNDLPSSEKLRDDIILRAMGSPSPDGRQIDGIGGGNSLSSKVVIVGRSSIPGIDVDYLLCQVHLKKSIVETTLNCGNMLSAVAPFAIEQGLVKATQPETIVKIFNENTGVVMESTVQTPQGEITYEGSTTIDGVPGTGAPVKLTFLDAVGSKTKKLLPTGNVVDDIEGISVSCVDVAVPMVIINAKHIGKTGYESKESLDNDKDFMEKLETVRQAAAKKMGLGDVTGKINPKICMVAAAKHGGTITSRYFTPFDCHDAHAVSGGLCLAAACLIRGSVANQYADLKSVDMHTHVRSDSEIVIEHVSGTIITAVTYDYVNDKIDFPLASFIRTARPLSAGVVYVPVTEDLKNRIDKDKLKDRIAKENRANISVVE
ncbi:MAG: 4-oxalomesaconate tautomerase [Solimicrobium sp.]|nr:4-oxalomesaconate tautomerase [Solimicrobium sp.]